MPHITAHPNSDRDRQGPARVSPCSCFHMRNKTTSRERAFPPLHSANHRTQKSQDLDSPAPLIPGFSMGPSSVWSGPLRSTHARLYRPAPRRQDQDLAVCNLSLTASTKLQPTTTPYYL